MSARSRRRHRRTSRKRNPFFVVLLVIGSMLAVGVIGSGLWLLSVYESAPSLANLSPITHGAVSKVYAADGSLIGVIHSDKIRQPIPSSKIPQDLKDATVAIEDRRFYSHGGIDPSAIVRAGWEDLTAGGKPVEGGSTITQQLVRNLYIEDPQDTLKRKIIEAHLANDEEDQHSKDWILTAYLNTASYGTNEGATAIGVEAAAETYYSKHARDLTLTEAAMIAGLPQAPVPVQPAAQPARGAGPAKRGAARDGAAGQDQRDRIRECPRPGSGPRPGTEVQPDPRALHLRPRQAGAPGPLWGEHRPERRAQGLYDDPAAPPAGGAERGRLLLGLLLGRGPGVGTGLGRPLERRDRRPGLDPALLTDQPVQLRRPRPAPAGVLVQGLRPDRRDQGGHRPRHDLLRRHLAQDAGDPRRLELDGQQRRGGRRGGASDRGDLGVGQRRLRPARPRRRSREHRQDRL